MSMMKANRVQAPRHSLGVLAPSRERRRSSIRGVRISEPHAQLLQAKHKKTPASEKSQVLGRSSTQAFRRLCARAEAAETKTLYEKLLLGVM
jgi:hypothetical protein